MTYSHDHYAETALIEHSRLQRLAFALFVQPTAKGKTTMAHVSKNDVRKEYYRLLDALDVGSQNAAATQGYLDEMRAAAMRLSNIGERECNGVIGADGFAKWDDADQAKADRERANAEKRVADALDALFDSETRKRIVLEFQGDPRGPSVRIHIEGRRDIVTLW